MRWLAFLLIPFLMALDVPLEDAKAEARAKALMEEIRCVACENEPISQSGADIAGDMRARIREMIAAGATDQDVRDWFAGRYGEFVLFRPSTEGLSGQILWGLPFGLLLIGALGLGLARRGNKVDGEIIAVSPDTFDADHKKETDA
jgi:cytochrome c-type biogenesis protein CcmH